MGLLNSKSEDFFYEGFMAAKNGRSVHYNPYRNLGLNYSKAFNQWVDGWKTYSKREFS